MTLPASLPWIEKLIAAQSISQTSNRPVLDLLAAEFEAHGLTPHYTYSEDGERANLFVTVPAADGGTDGGVVLSGHTDVVPVEGQAWTVTAPFTPLVKDGKLYGRGASDMKSFIGSAMWLLPQLLEAKLAKPVHFAFSYDEEIGCVGAPAMVKDFKARGINPDFAVIGEPSMMQVISAHKGAHRGRVTFKGIAKHASLGPHGVNALAQAAEFITFFEQLAGTWRENGPFDEGFVVPYSTGGVNFARGGIQYNIVGEHVVLEYDFRTVPQMTTDEVLALVEAKIADDLLPALKARAADAEALSGAAPGEFVDAVGITHELLAAVPALGTADGAEIIALANEWAGRPGSVEAQKVTYGTEAGQFALYGGVQAVVCGPGDIAQAHTPNEWIELAQIEACDRFMLKVLEWASQEQENTMTPQDAGARPRRRIRVFPEWGIDFPLWGAPSELEQAGEYPYPYDPDDLPQVPSDLVEELAAWSQAWATRVAEEMGEIPPRPLTQQERHQEELEWKNQGKALVENLRAVLGDDFEIIYKG